MGAEQQPVQKGTLGRRHFLYIAAGSLAAPFILRGSAPETSQPPILRPFQPTAEAVCPPVTYTDKLFSISGSVALLSELISGSDDKNKQNWDRIKAELHLPTGVPLKIATSVGYPYGLDDTQETQAENAALLLAQGLTASAVKMLGIEPSSRPYLTHFVDSSGDSGFFIIVSQDIQQKC